MKRVYPLMLAVCAFMTVLLPQTAHSQCNCPGGGTIVQIVPVDTSTANYTPIVFNKYYDPTGQTILSCMKIDDTLSAVSTTLMTNKASSPMFGATFTITVGLQITGPGSLLKGQTSANDYGPYDFGSYGATSAPYDSVQMGPDTFFNNKVNSFSPPNIAPYIGPGTVSDTVTFGGGFYSISGTNYDFRLRTKYWGVFKITYYYCPAPPLATAITGFTAVNNGNSILLKWITNNEQTNINYEIQISTDGKQFTTIGDLQSDPATAGATTKHQYQYNLDQTNVGKLYFRIKETDNSGKVSYTTVLVVNPDGSVDPGPPSYQTYPNPATTNLTLQFNQDLTGRYLLELINTTGQTVIRKAVTLTSANQISLGLNPQPPKGLYFLRTTDLTHNQAYVSKVLIN